MKKLAAVVCAVFVAALILGVASPALAAGKTHQVKATVVSVDAAAKTITIKDEKGEEKTAPVMDKAVDELKNIKAGDKVTLTCHDNDKGEHEGVTAIKKG
jgi:Cu/Ag efflux protein CusF